MYIRYLSEWCDHRDRGKQYVLWIRTGSAKHILLFRGLNQQVLYYVPRVEKNEKIKRTSFKRTIFVYVTKGSNHGPRKIDN